MPPSSEDFARWRDDSVTRWVFKALDKRTEEQRLLWISHSWSAGQANPILLKELQSRATAFVEVIDNQYEDWCGIHEEEPIYVE